MGFGLLTVGYFAVYLMSIHTYGFIFHILGFILCFYGARKLKGYTDAARPLLAVSLIMAFLSAANGGIILACKSGAISSAAIGDISGQVFNYSVFFFNAALLYAIRKISFETEVFKISASALRNFIFLFFYYFLTIVALILKTIFPGSGIYIRNS